MTSATLLFEAHVYGHNLQVFSLGGRHMLAAEGLASVLGYRTVNGVRMAYSRHQKALEAHSAKAKISEEGWVVRLYDEFCLRYFCEYSKSPGAVHLLRWLDAGGMTIEGVRTESTPAADSNVLAFKATTSAPLAGKSERQRAYCRDLLKTLLRYATDAETEELTHTIESEVADLLNRRHCPGLNDARYELFRRFWLSGGEV